MALLALALPDRSDGKLDAMQIARGAVSGKSFGEDKLGDAPERALH